VSRGTIQIPGPETETHPIIHHPNVDRPVKLQSIPEPEPDPDRTGDWARGGSSFDHSMDRDQVRSMKRLPWREAGKTGGIH
jgi:hypothetical protein